jgi:hypothetical protein
MPLLLVCDRAFEKVWLYGVAILIHIERIGG